MENKGHRWLINLAISMCKIFPVLPYCHTGFGVRYRETGIGGEQKGFRQASGDPPEGVELPAPDRARAARGGVTRG